jgi:hypothetical protein
MLTGRRAPALARLVVAVSVTLGIVAAPAVLAPSAACASEGGSAALVVDTGARTTRYCVAIGTRTVSGLDVVELAAKQYGLDYRLGYGGKAVCRLAGVGVDSAECLEGTTDFWGYWRGAGSSWSWSALGAAETSVGPGDVEGWAWGAGTTGATHRQPPPTTYASVCGERSPDPNPPASGDGGRGGSGGNGGQGPETNDVNGGGGTGENAASGSPTAAPVASGVARTGGRDAVPASPRAASDRGANGATAGDGHPPPTPSDPGAGAATAPGIEARPVAAAPVRAARPPVFAIAFAVAAVILLGAAGWLAVRGRPLGR